MAFTLDAGAIIKGGAVCGALTAIAACTYGAIIWVTPYFQTKPPFAEKVEVDQLAQTQAQQQSNLASMQQNQLFLTQQFWINALAQSQALLRQNPNNLAARQQEIAAQQALAGIQRQLYTQPR